MGKSDFFMESARLNERLEPTSMQFSRKQSGELLGNLDEAERQVARYCEQSDESYQIVEGIISPTPMYAKKGKAGRLIMPPNYGRSMYSYSVTDEGFITGERAWKVSPAMYWSWLRSLDRAGVTTYFTLNWKDTAQMLSAIYANESKDPDSHTTLRRVIKPNIQLGKQSDFVKAMMFLSHVYELNVGEAKATAIENSGFNSILDVAMAEMQDLVTDGIGKTTANKILKAFGRTDV